MAGKIVAVCVAPAKGIPKEDVGEGLLVEEEGLEGDAHRGFAHRQVSLLNAEDIARAREKMPSLGPGSFAENLTVEGFDLGQLKVGDRITVGDALLEVSQDLRKRARSLLGYGLGDVLDPGGKTDI